MDLIQSYIFTVGRGDLSLYEQRILLRIVEHAQEAVKGLYVGHLDGVLPHHFDNVRIDVPARYLLTEGSKHYEHVKRAALSLMQRTVMYEDPRRGIWFATPLIYNVRYQAGQGLLTFYVARELFDVILDFSKGFKRYNLNAALSLNSPAAIRMFQLMESQRGPITFTVEWLKAMFGVEKKYSQTAGFIKKVIEPAQKALDAAGLTGFTFTRVKHGNKVTALTFTPIHRTQWEETQLAAKLPVARIVNSELIARLMADFSFTTKELSAHKTTLKHFSNLPNTWVYYNDLLGRSRGKTDPKAWVIGSIKSIVKQAVL